MDVGAGVVIGVGADLPGGVATDAVGAAGDAVGPLDPVPMQPPSATDTTKIQPILAVRRSATGCLGADRGRSTGRPYPPVGSQVA
jgi:hypothetical protein